MTQIWTKRAYAEAHANDGTRILVEGIETRGVFGERDGRMTALPVAPLREMIDAL